MLLSLSQSEILEPELGFMARDGGINTTHKKYSLMDILICLPVTIISL